MAKKSELMVWIDLEMTGLEPDECTIIEIATIITDGDLEVVATGPNLAIHQPDEVLEAMDEWNTTHHTESGLVARVRSSEVDLAEAQRRTLDFVKMYVKAKKAPLCGNTIGQDRRFLRAYMPDLEDYLHYRSVDVSSIKELVKRWYPKSKLPPKKKAAHLALDDIIESIAELRYYREHIFVKP